jgi:biotin carboxyl carrier protein
LGSVVVAWPWGARVTVTNLGHGCFQIVHDGRQSTVYVTGPPGRRWAFFDGRVFREEELSPDVAARRGSRPGGQKQITAPMPATVLQVLTSPGAAVSRGDTLVIVEAMKMEMPLTAPDDGVVRDVRCRPGDLVQPDAVLVELE